MRRRIHWPAVLVAFVVLPISIGLILRAFGRQDLGSVYRSLREGQTEGEVRRMAGEPSVVLAPQEVRRYTGETTPSGTVGWHYVESRSKSSLIVIFRNGSVVKTVLVRT